MKKTITHLMMLALVGLLTAHISKAALISDAGTASVSADSVCPGTETTLILAGYTGNIQWQSYDGSTWIDETGTGATTDNYNVTPAATTDYRAVVTDPGFPSDTSNVVTVIVGLQPPTTTGATRCGYGQVTLTASTGAPNVKWYDTPTGGTALYTGASFTTNVASTTTFYAAAASDGGGAATITLPAHNNVYTGYTRGYWFTSPVDFTITSLYIPTDASTDNQSICVLTYPVGPTPPLGLNTFGFTTKFMTQNDPATGSIAVNIPILAGEHVVIIGNRGSDTITDFGAINSYDSGTPFTTIIDGINVDLIRAGMQSNLTGFDPQVVGVYIDIPNGQKGRIEFEYEIGCESSRAPAIADVTSSQAITISAVPPALCAGQSTVISVSSGNPNYSYTWSPATGLSGTTGASNTSTPALPITYTIIADDGTCGAIDSVFIDVGPASVAGTATISSDTICVATDAFLLLSGYTGDIQWQGNDGSGWVDETGTGNNTSNYAVSPVNFMQYRAVVTSGGCSPDTTGTLSLTVISIVDPTTVNDTICAPGFASLSASGTGQMSWYTSASGGIPVHVGNGYSPNISATTTYYVQASAGGIFNTGPASLSIGSQQNSTGFDYGLQFDVNQQCVLEKVSISAAATGNVTINLRDIQNGPILNTITIPVIQFTGLTPVYIGFTLNPGTYRLELQNGSADLYYNNGGALYPYTTTGSPVIITGAVDPTFNAGNFYYFFYNWEIKAGCASNLIPVTGFVNTPPAVPTISQNGTILTSSAPSNNQWYINGIPIIGATGTTHDMSFTGSGTYTVSVTVDGCASTSAPVVYTGITELEQAGISVYPNPVSEVLNISFQNPARDVVINIHDGLGKLLYSEKVSGMYFKLPWKYPSGIYTIEIQSENGRTKSQIVKL